MDLRALHFQTHDANIDHAFPRFLGTWYSHFDIFTFRVFVSGMQEKAAAGSMRSADPVTWWTQTVDSVSDAVPCVMDWLGLEMFDTFRNGLSMALGESFICRGLVLIMNKLNIRTFNDGPC